MTEAPAPPAQDWASKFIKPSKPRRRPKNVIPFGPQPKVIFEFVDGSYEGRVRLLTGLGIKLAESPAGTDEAKRRALLCKKAREFGVRPGDWIQVRSCGRGQQTFKLGQRLETRRTEWVAA